MPLINISQFSQFKIYCYVFNSQVQNKIIQGKITPDHDISSELAGYEISKLLKDQQKLEDNYAKLVALRTTLVGITNKKDLLQTQGQIQNVAKNLKESTKKLCRLFKENPDLEGDSLKVARERQELISDFEDLIGLIQNSQLSKFQNNVTTELEEQDLLRKYAAREKELITEIKRLQSEKNQEYKDYQNESNEKQKTIQALKEKLLYKSNRSELKEKYDEKVAKAKENTNGRIFEYKQKDVESEINIFKNKTKTEQLVNGQLKEYLSRKEDEVKKKSEEWSRHSDKCRNDLEEEIEKMTEQKNTMLEELENFKRRFEREEIQKQEKERKELKDIENKIYQEMMQKKLENAISMIQDFYEKKKASKKPKKKKVVKKAK